MYEFLEDLKKRAEAGDAKAREDYDEIMTCLNTMDDDRVANCIILLKEKFPKLENQAAILIKKYVVNKDRSLDKLSPDEVELVEFLRGHLKEDI